MSCINPSRALASPREQSHWEVKTCRQADEEHNDSERQYAHVFHRIGVICVAKAFWSLPEAYRMGILLHEVGHILAGTSASEAQATRKAAQSSGVAIEYRDSPYGDELEWVSPKDLGLARRYLGL